MEARRERLQRRKMRNGAIGSIDEFFIFASKGVGRDLVFNAVGRDDWSALSH